MPQSRYIYNSDTCKFEKRSFPVWNILSYIVALGSSGLVFAISALLLFNQYYESPLESALRKENADLIKYQNVLNKELSLAEKDLSKLKETDGRLYERIYEANPETFKSKQASLQQKEDLILGDFNDFKTFYSQTIKKAKKKHNESQLRSYMAVANWTNNEKRFEVDFMPSVHPVDNMELTKLASGFGIRINPFHKGRYLHDGIDFAAPRGSDVKATASGTIKLIKKSDLQAGYGNYIEIDHGNGYITRYAHLEELIVKQGQQVKKNQVIAQVGMSGGASAPHLHYEVIYRGNKVNPVHYLVEDMDEKSFEIIKRLSARENQALD
jgi:murein DD-endopeptidase MepM/ murein hydrolase activator NlpD